MYTQNGLFVPVIIFTNDLHRNLVHTNCILFADDTTIYYTHENLRYLKWCLEEDLKIIADWFKANQLTLNISKSVCMVFRWFKFTLKPPYRIAIGNFFSAIWDTSHWNFLVKFGLKTAWDMSYDILLSLLKFVNFWRLQGRLSILAKIGCLQKIKVFLMKEQQGFDATWGF